MNRRKDHCKERRYTKAKTQILTGINQREYSKLENRKRYYIFKQCRQIMLVINTNMDYLAGLTDEKKPYPRSK